MCTRGRSPPWSTPPIRGAMRRDQRSQHENEHRGGQERPRYPVLNQPADGIPERHGAHSVKARLGGIAPSTRRPPIAGASIDLPWTPQPPSPRPLPCSTSGSRRERPASASSASATPAFRSRSCSPTRASTSPASTWTSERVRWVNERRSYLVDVPPERYEAAGDRLSATSDYAAVSRARRADDLRPDAAVEDAHARHLVCRAAGEAVASHLRPGQLVILQSTTYPRHDARDPAADPRGGRPQGRQTDFFLGYAPERVDPGNKTWTRPHDAQARRGRHRGVPPAHARPSTRRSSIPSCRSRARPSPRPRSCTRTPSAPSTSRSRTSWR